MEIITFYSRNYYRDGPWEYDHKYGHFPPVCTEPTVFWGRFLLENCCMIEMKSGSVALQTLLPALLFLSTVKDGKSNLGERRT